MDDVLKQFRSFCADNAANPDLLSFILGSSSLDVVLHSAMANKVEYEHLWSLSRKIQLLSHGQASVERGFSVNKEIMLENMLEHTLKAQRTISDHIKSVGGALNVKITKELVLSAFMSRQGILHIWMRFKKRKRKVKKERNER